MLFTPLIHMFNNGLAQVPNQVPEVYSNIFVEDGKMQVKRIKIWCLMEQNKDKTVPLKWNGRNFSKGFQTSG
jgi:hypothetical protein